MTFENALQLAVGIYILVGVIIAAAWVTAPKTRIKRGFRAKLFALIIIVLLWPKGLSYFFKKGDK